MSADNLSENTRTENTPASYEAFITFLETFGYGYKSRKDSEGFEDDNDSFRRYIVNYIKKIDSEGKIESPETVANKVNDVIFKEFSKGNLKLNYLRKIIEDEHKKGESEEDAEIYAKHLVALLFKEKAETLNQNQINYLKDKFNNYWRHITVKKCSQLLPKAKEERKTFRFVSIENDSENPDKPQIRNTLPAKIKNPEEEFLFNEYLEIYRKCLSKHLPELKKKFFRNLREDYFSILIRRYFSKEFTVQDEINISPDEFIKNKNFVIKTIDWIWSGFGLKAKDYQKATGEPMRWHDDTREKTAGYFGISLNDFDNKVSIAKSFLAENMQNCLQINKKQKKV